MQFVYWLTGVCITIACCKIVLRVFRRLTSKDNIDDMIDRATDGINNTADRVADSIRQKKEQRKKEKQPIVTIR